MPCKLSDAKSFGYQLTKLLDIEGKTPVPKVVFKGKSFSTLPEMAAVIGEYGNAQHRKLDECDQSYYGNGDVFEIDPYRGMNYIYKPRKSDGSDLSDAELCSLKSLVKEKRSIYVLVWYYHIIAEDEEGETIPDYAEDGELKSEEFDSIDGISEFIQDLPLEQNGELLYQENEIDPSRWIDVQALDDDNTGYLPDIEGLKIVEKDLSLFPRKRRNDSKEVVDMSVEEFEWILRSACVYPFCH
jgi:hypothetical protein